MVVDSFLREKLAGLKQADTQRRANLAQEREDARIAKEEREEQE